MSDLLHLAQLTASFIRARDNKGLQVRLVPVSSLARTIRKAVPDVKSTQDLGETGSGAFLLGVMSARTFNNAFGYVKYACKAVPFRNLVLQDTKVEENTRQTAACGTHSLNASAATVA